MAESSSRAREEGAVQALRFGAFEMDVKSGELRRDGRLVRLQPQPFKVLALLLERPGEVVTRDEIQSKVWAAGTFVDFEQSLNFCIRQIRSALGDSAMHPRYVETLPRRGYRFVGGAVETVHPQATVHQWPRPVSEQGTNGHGDTPVSTAVAPQEALDPRWGTVALVLAAAAVFLGALAFAYRLGGRPDPTRPRPSFQRITFQSGAVTSARFGPEHQVVYGATWEGRGLDLHEVNSGARESRQLGIEEAEIVAASKTEIAFLRQGVLARAPLAGGPPRSVSRSIQAADWTSDTSEFAVIRYEDHRFYLEYPIGRRLGETHSVSRLRLSPDGTLVALAEHPMFGDDRGRVVILDEDGNRLAQSRAFGSLDGLAWAPEGDEVWFTAAEVGVKSEMHGLSPDGSVRHVHAAMGRLVLHDVARDGRILLERTGAGGETFIGGVGLDQPREISWLDLSGVEGLSANGRVALLVESGDGGGPDYTSYLRPTDGSLPVRLGPGRGTSLTPDGKWALMIPVRTPEYVERVPTGPGRSRRYQIPGKAIHEMAGWIGDGRTFYVVTRDPDGIWEHWLVDARSGQHRPLSVPAGVLVHTNTFSPDGTRFAARCPGAPGYCVYDLEGGDPVPLAGVAPGWRAVGWDEKDRVFFRARESRVPEMLWTVDVSSGEVAQVAELAPPDRSGVLGLTRVTVARSGETWAFSLIRSLSDLYVVTDLY